MRELKQFGIIPFSNGVLKSLLKEYKSPNDRISKLMDLGEILSVKKGMYVVSQDYRSQKISLEILANNLYGPSYISLDFALSYYGFITEKVIMVTSLTPKRSKKIDTSFGVFNYLHAPVDYYQVGITQEVINNEHTFLIASPEKALCDKIVFTKNLNINSVKDMRLFLIDDLRIDLVQIRDLDLTILKECEKTGIKQKEIALLIKTIEKLTL